MNESLNRAIRFEEFLLERFGAKHVRDGNYITSITKTIPNGGSGCVVTTKDTHVYFPARFEKARLAFIQNNYDVVGYLAVVSGGKYGVISLPCLLTMNPSSVQTVKIDEVEYLELHFEAGVTLFETTRLSKDSTLVYPIYNELISKPNLPVYFSYKDALMCLRKTGKFANLSLEKTNVATEVIIATTTRDSTNPQLLFRQALAKGGAAKPVFYGLRNIQHGVTNVPTAIMGSYSDMGVDSLLVNPPVKLDKYEELLRV